MYIITYILYISIRCCLFGPFNINQQKRSRGQIPGWLCIDIQGSHLMPHQVRLHNQSEQGAAHSSGPLLNSSCGRRNSSLLLWTTSYIYIYEREKERDENLNILWYLYWANSFTGGPLLNSSRGRSNSSLGLWTTSYIYERENERD